MGQRQIPSLAGVVQSDTAATANALAERDPSGDLYQARCRASAGVVNNGEVYTGIANKTTSFAADATQATVTCDTTAGSITATLPAASTCAGKKLTFKKTVAANSLIIDGNAAETIDGATTKTYTTQYAFVTVQSDGTGWHIVGLG